jgi:hypothetical protein
MLRGLLDAVFLILWAKALCSIAAKVKQKEKKILPNIRMIMTHGVLLGVYIFFWFVLSVVTLVGEFVVTEQQQFDAWFTAFVTLAIVASLLQ